MIPQFNQSGVLPPYDQAAGPTSSAGRSPYKTNFLSMAQRFGTSPERESLLRGLLDCREALRQIGVENGIQWINGSFVEDVESIRKRPPGDIDLVTFAHRPLGISQSEWNTLTLTHPDLFRPSQAKQKYHCDAYFVDLDLSPRVVVSRTAYWNGLFAHQRQTDQWKGIVEVPLTSDDAAARAYLTVASP